MFLDATGQVVSSADMAPCPAGTVDLPDLPGRRAPTAAAIEVPAGQLAALGLDGRRTGSRSTVGRASLPDLMTPGRRPASELSHPRAIVEPMRESASRSTTMHRSIDDPAPTVGAPARGRVQREVMRSMRAYELMIIFDGDVEDAGVTEGLARVAQQVEAGGGKVAKTDLWGRRRFAYEINHKFEGIYVVLEIVDRGRSTSTTSSAPCASRTRSSATS